MDLAVGLDERLSNPLIVGMIADRPRIPRGESRYSKEPVRPLPHIRARCDRPLQPIPSLDEGTVGRLVRLRSHCQAAVDEEAATAFSTAGGSTSGVGTS